jgi:formylglycine-generating enzyme required for sulfatase activity
LGSRTGEDDFASDDEYGHDRPFDLKYPYWMARYPVTQLQYQIFVQAAGHRLPYREEDWAQPYNWNEEGPPSEKRNHPVVLVSWHDAVAYSAWLTAQLGEVLPKGYAVRLPTEAEWEKAARGGLEIPEQPYVAEVETIRESLPAEMIKLRSNSNPQRRWPWGEWGDDSHLLQANTGESGRQQTMAVGSFPAGASPYGCLDMAGNVWEWCLSQYKKYPYQNDDRNQPEGKGRRMLRGGSWAGTLRYARVSSRTLGHPATFNFSTGFRLVIAPVLP